MSLVLGERAGQRAFWRFWSASTVSGVGDAVTAVALPLTAIGVLHATAFQVSLVTAASYVAWLLLGLPAGVLVQHLPLRGTQVTMDLVRGLALATVPVAAWLGTLTLTQLVLVALTVNVAGVVFDVGNMSFVPSVVPADELAARNSLLYGTRSVNQLVGPGIGGLLVQLVGAVASLGVDVASYLVSALLLRALPRPARVPVRGGASVRGQIAEGWRYVAQHPVMGPCLADATAVNFACTGLIALTPLYVVRVLHAGPFLVGLLIASEGAGALLGAAVATRVLGRWGSARATIGAGLLGGAAALLLPLGSGSAGAVLFALGNAGFALGTAVCGIAIYTHRQQEAPPALLLRVMATTRFVSWSVMPFGALVAGAVASLVSVHAALWLFAVVTLLGPALLLASPVRRRRDLAG